MHAQDLATRHGGIALPLSELDRHLAEADIVISATASRTAILSRAQVAAALGLRKHRPMLLLDLAVPRDIDAAASDLKDAYLYTVDDLERAVEDNRSRRREAAEQAEAIVELQAIRFSEQLAASTRSGPLRQLRAHGDAARTDALAKARQQLAAGASPHQALEFLAHTLTNKLLHAPTVALRDAALAGDGELARAAEACSRQQRRSTPDHDPGLRPSWCAAERARKRANDRRFPRPRDRRASAAVARISALQTGPKRWPPRQDRRDLAARPCGRSGLRECATTDRCCHERCSTSKATDGAMIPKAARDDGGLYWRPTARWRRGGVFAATCLHVFALPEARAEVRLTASPAITAATRKSRPRRTAARKSK